MTAGDIFNRETDQESNRTIPEAGLISKARDVFLEERVNLADLADQILEIDGGYVDIAKTAQTTPASKPLLTGSCACGAIS
ncbi:Nonribosomal peptide synthetase 1 [Venturia inaequalis]|nr:Nonribosomal peptide synthetase 1 [Venturia inaequalis]